MSEGLIYNMVTKMDKIVFSNWFSKRLKLKCCHQKKTNNPQISKQVSEVINVLNNYMERALLSQCILISNHHVIHCKYLTILFFKYTIKIFTLPIIHCLGHLIYLHGCLCKKNKLVLGIIFSEEQNQEAIKWFKHSSL